MHPRDASAGIMRRVIRQFLIPLLLVSCAAASSHDDLSVDQLKARVSAVSDSDKVHLCVQIAEKQLDTADKLYTAGQVDQAQPALTDVVAFSELARDYSIQSRKHQKQTEISVRAMTRKLTDILHLLGHEDQAPVRDAISHLEKVRDDLLTSMFPKGVK
jgi:soluble cytochrome b562